LCKFIIWKISLLNQSDPYQQVMRRGCGVHVIVVVDMGDMAQSFLVDDVGDVAVVNDDDVAVVVVIYDMVVVLVVDGVVWWQAL